MNDLTWLADFAWQHKMVICWSLTGLFVAWLFVAGRLNLEERVTPGLASLLLIWGPAYALFTPWLAFLTWYCYRFPERIGGDPDPLMNWGNDLRNYWKPVALFFAGLLVYALQGWWKYEWNSVRARAQRTLRRAYRLRDAGRHGEAVAAYREYQRICAEGKRHPAPHPNRGTVPP